MSNRDETKFKRTYHVTPHCEPMVAAVPVCPLVPRCELAAAEDLIRLSLRLERERGIDLAAVDQERRPGLLAIFLQV